MGFLGLFQVAVPTAVARFLFRVAHGVSGRKFEAFKVVVFL